MPNRAAPPRHEREQFWRDLIARQQRSGQSVAAFCRAHDVSQPSFFSWRKRLRLHTDTPPSSFVPVQIDLSSSLAHAASIEIVLRSGACVRVSHGCDRQTLETVLAVLEPPPC
jgi:transposase-like protein